MICGSLSNKKVLPSKLLIEYQQANQHIAWHMVGTITTKMKAWHREGGKGRTLYPDMSQDKAVGQVCGLKSG